MKKMRKIILALLSVGLFFSSADAAVSGAQKKAMSTFLSNFTELRFMDFSADDILDPADPADAIRFGIRHNYGNNFNSRIVPCKNKKCPHGSLTIDAKFVTESIEKYFGFKFKAHQTAQYGPDRPYFYDGKLYHFEGSDGEATHFARVKDAELANGVWTATGELYNADDESDILSKFTAAFKPHKWGGKDTYSIVSMKTELRDIADFIDHFTEYLSEPGIARKHLTNEWLINFGIWENYIFDAEKTRNLENGVTTVEAKYVAEAVKKYLNLDVKHQSIERIVYDEQKKIYTFDAADGARPEVSVYTVETMSDGNLLINGDLSDDSDETTDFIAELGKHKYNGEDVYYLISLRIPE